MATCVSRNHLVCTLGCTNIQVISAWSASLHLYVINFSDLFIDRRDTICSFTSSFSETTKTISVFAKYTGERGLFRTDYMGISIGERQVCTRFYNHGSRLLCTLASSAAEVAFYTNSFPPPPLKAQGRFVEANSISHRTKFLKITMVHSRVRVLEHGRTTHPSHVRYASLTATTNGNIAAGILFVYVNKADSERIWVRGRFQGSTELDDSLQTAYPTGRYPNHIVEFLEYLDSEGRQDRSCRRIYLEGLKVKDVAHIIDVMIVGIDVLPQPVLIEMYKLVGEKLDEFGDETLSDTSRRLGFITN